MDINRNAPVTASAETVIDAPLKTVWQVQYGIKQWPEWNPAIKWARLSGPKIPGTRFRWKSGLFAINSRLEEVEKQRRLVWTGQLLGIRAVHVWTFEEVEGGTHVRTEESFEGLLARLFPKTLTGYLHTALEQGLAALKAEAEQRERG